MPDMHPMKWIAAGFAGGLSCPPLLPPMLALAILAAGMRVLPAMTGPAAGHPLSLLFFRKRRAAVRIQHNPI